MVCLWAVDRHSAGDGFPPPRERRRWGLGLSTNALISREQYANSRRSGPRRISSEAARSRAPGVDGSRRGGRWGARDGPGGRLPRLCGRGCGERCPRGGGPRRYRVRQRGGGRRRGKQGPRDTRQRVPRLLLGAPGRGARRHERALHRRANSGATSWPGSSCRPSSARHSAARSAI